MCKVGDKFVIEIGGEYPGNPFENGENGKAPTILYKIKGFDSLVFDENGLDRLEKAENLERLAYDRGYSKAEKDYFKQTEVERESALQSGYEKGLYDAWEVAKKICLNPDDGGIDSETIEKIFGATPYAVAKGYTPQEAIDKLKEWEEKQEIKVGDVVNYANVLIAVTYMNKENGTFSGIDTNGESYIDRRLSDCKKTGKHIDLTGIFKGLEVENGD